MLPIELAVVEAETGPGARLPLVGGPRRPAQGDRVFLVRGDDPGRIGGAQAHQLDQRVAGRAR